MLRTVDLDQLAAAVPTIARLIGARAARNTISPDTGLDHQLSQRLARSADVMTLGQILGRSEEHTSELQSLMRISYAVFCLKKKKTQPPPNFTQHNKRHTKQNV